MKDKKETPEESKELKQCTCEKDELKETLQRVQAEFENYKKRCDKENNMHIQRKLGGFMSLLLPVVDSFEHAIKQNNDSGFKLIYTQLKTTLEKEGLKRIQTERYDPYQHEVLMTEETEDPKKDNMIAEELQTGYTFNNMTLRPAKVKMFRLKEDTKEDKDARDGPEERKSDS